MNELGFGPEFTLLVRCCQWNFAAAGERPRPGIASDLDWNLFLRLARRHRVQALIWNALSQHAEILPSSAKKQLSSDARSIASTNLAISTECRRLRQVFEQSNIPLLFIKGLSLSSLAYRSPLMKMGWDIDLLIDPSDLATAAELLLERGFALLLPGSFKQLRSWHTTSKESVWERSERLYVELHTRLADNQRLIPGIDVHSPKQMVQVGPNISLPTLAEDELFAYLAVHGASSAWFRLKWISDFAALLHGRSDEEIGRLYRRSQDLGAGRAAGQALLVADSLFGSLRHNSALRNQLAADRATRMLCRAALRMMTKGDCEPTEQLLGTLSIHWTQLLLRPGIAFKASELRRQGESVLGRYLR